MRARNSFWTKLVQDEVDTREFVVDSIRQAMMDAVDELRNLEARALDDDISKAESVTDLWNMRPALIKLIAAEQGSDAAKVRGNRITEMFAKY
jgi:hypothetical protein